MTERDEQVIALYGQGLSQRQIARTVGLSQPGVRKVLLRWGVLVPKEGGDNPQHCRRGQADNRAGRGDTNPQPEQRTAPGILPAESDRPTPRAGTAGGAEAPSSASDRRRTSSALGADNQPGDGRPQSAAHTSPRPADRPHSLLSLVPQETRHETPLQASGGRDAFGGGITAGRVVRCEWCQAPFLHRRHGARFCCNSCGARAAGLTPRTRHSPDCRRCDNRDAS